jgi:hypothetical protein
MLEGDQHTSTTKGKCGVKKRIYLRKKMNCDQFKSEVSNLVQSIDPDLTTTEDAITSIQTAINMAAKTATPYTDISVGKKTNKRWTPELAQAVKVSKQEHHRWKEAGRPAGDDPLYTLKKKAAKKVRTILRHQRAEDRGQLIQEISQATERDQALAHRLIRKQRGQGERSTALWIRGELVIDDIQIREEWANYCEELAGRDTNPAEAQMLEYMRALCNTRDEKVTIDIEQVTKAIKHLKSGKAMDSGDICARTPSAGSCHSLDLNTSVVKCDFC